MVLFVSDFDPEGEDIAHSFARSMRDDFGIEGIVPIKAALTAEQVKAFQLPPQMKAKEGSSRRRGFVGEHGENVFELEALAPEQLQGIVRTAIEGVLDLDAFGSEQDAERNDAARLEALRRGAIQAVGEVASDLEDGFDIGAFDNT